MYVCTSCTHVHACQSLMLSSHQDSPDPPYTESVIGSMSDVHRMDSSIDIMLRHSKHDTLSYDLMNVINCLLCVENVRLHCLRHASLDDRSSRSMLTSDFHCCHPRPVLQDTNFTFQAACARAHAHDPHRTACAQSRPSGYTCTSSKRGEHIR